MNHILTTLAVTVALSLPVAVVTTPPDGSPVAALFPPWWDGSRTALAAMQGGPVSGFGGAGFVALLPRGAPARLRAAGAWLVLPAALFGGCGVVESMREIRT